MSSILVIQLDKTPIPKVDYIHFLALCEDDLYRSQTDYDLESYTIDKVKEWIESDLSGIATLDVENRTLTFADKDTVRKKWLDSAESAFRTFRKEAAAGSTLADFNLRRSISQACGIGILPYYDGYCHHASTFLEDYVTGHLPRTIHIGALLQGHC